MKWKAMLIVFVAVLTACGQGAITTSGKGEEPAMKTDWSFDVEVKQGNDELLVDMRLTNQQDQVATIDFSSGQKYELILVDEQGEEVYRYSEGKMFTMALIHESIEPREAIRFQDAIPISNLAPGTYQLDVSLVIAAINGDPLAEDEQFLIQKEITIES